ncbi:hypothetical protein PCANB_000019 [Pneumocystis canis]|nr:hypothetical protein PCANB_000019 [Pneumocystis canis]
MTYKEIRQLIEDQPVLWVDLQMSIKEACQAVFIKNDLSLLLIRKSPTSHIVSGVFDDTDFTAFLPYLFHCDEMNEEVAFFQTPDIIMNLKDQILMKFISDIKMKNTFTIITADICLSEVAKIFGMGIYHVIAEEANCSKVIGIMRDLNIEYSNVVSIGDDKPVIEAIEMMLDFHKNILGSISILDIKNAIKFKLKSLFKATCSRFLSVIKYEQDLKNGKDITPCLLITENLTLAYVIAKFVATGSHCLWLIRDLFQPSTLVFITSSITTSPSLYQSGMNIMYKMPTFSPNSSANQIHGIMFSNLEFLKVITFTDICALIAKVVNNSFDTFQLKWRTSSTNSSPSFNSNKISSQDIFKE